MTSEEIHRLAQKDIIDTKEELDDKLTELKSMKLGILECTMYVLENQQCSLMDAKTIVINSSAWIDKKKEFIEYQQEQMAEFLDAAKNDIQTIEYTISLDEKPDKVLYKLKPKKDNS